MSNPTITATVDRVSEIETKYGPMQKILVNGTTYSVKGKNAPSDLRTGDLVTFEPEHQDNKWWNALGLTKAAAGTPVSPRQDAPGSPNAPQAIPSQGGSPGDERERRIVRQMALKAGVEIVGYTNTGGLEDDAIWAEIMRWSYKVYQVAYSEEAWKKQIDILNLNGRQEEP